jgi:hypothetical protein
MEVTEINSTPSKNSLELGNDTSVIFKFLKKQKLLNKKCLKGQILIDPTPEEESKWKIFVKNCNCEKCFHDYCSKMNLRK